MARFKLLIEYAGTRYSGWQIQNNARTVQGEIDRAVADATGRRDTVAVLTVLGSAALIAVVSLVLPSPFAWAGWALALITAACAVPVVALRRGTRLHADETCRSSLARVMPT